MPNDEDRPKPRERPPWLADRREEKALRVICDDKLKEILAAHEKWRETQEKEGQRADLSRANLQGADLQGAELQFADLQRANLEGANLQGADLEEANLEKAILRKANFQGAILKGANLKGTKLWKANLRGANLRRSDMEALKWNKNQSKSDDQAGSEQTGDAEDQPTDLSLADLRDANLSDAKLSTVTGLQSNQLGGADLSLAKLPADIAAFDGLSQVEEVSRNARKIFLAMLLGCAYAWLTIWQTTDARLLTNSSTSPLPIIGAEIPIAGFFWVAPLILLGFYVYFHFYLQRMWEGLAALPAVFPDGKPLHQKAYPWLLTGLVRANFVRLRDDQRMLSRMENGASIFLAWWTVPLTLAGFWLRYLPRHDWPWTVLLILGAVAATWAGLAFYHIARETLQWVKPQRFSWKKPWRSPGSWHGAAAVSVGVIIALVSIGAIEGDARRGRVSGPVVPGGIATWVPYAFDRVGYRAFANLREVDVSTRPENWWTAKVDERLDVIERATLQGRDLRHADAQEAFLAKADLRDANLQRANLYRANLQGADLRSADLQEADLDSANLHGADLRSADLQGAYLAGANLQEADLIGADLQGANLNAANLQEAHLSSADLQGAYLFGADLQGANLNAADLQGADLQGADLRRADLQGADLRRADLRGAKTLTQEQLDPACGDEKTRLSEGLTIELCWGLDLSGLDLRNFKGLTQAQLDHSCGDKETKLPELPRGLTIEHCSDLEPTAE